MDCIRMAPSNDWNQEEIFTAQKQRFDTFRLGKDRPTSMQLNHSKPAHARSHSRNTSVSSSASTFSFPTTTSLPKSTTTDMPPLPPVLSASKRNSHHRRQSSVSTRRESAEVMGVSVPDLPVSSSDDNINLGDKDSIRRRALLALEGKSELGVFSKMEIPELRATDIEPAPFEFSSKPTYPLSPSGFTGSVSSMLSGKRDSFGKALLSASSIKDQLHTLVEEEEEEDDQEVPQAAQESGDDSFSSVDADTSFATDVSETSEPTILPPAVVTQVTPVSVRPRPATLNIRQSASVAPSFKIDSGLPTPTLTPSPRSFGLRPLTLSPSPTLISPPSATTDAPKPILSGLRRLSLSSSVSSTASVPEVTRRPPLTVMTDSPSPPSSVDSNKLKRTSISYKSGNSPPHNFAMLPTPEMTPTTVGRRLSNASDSSMSESGFPGGRPLAAHEHHFLYKSHVALLSRIEDLERTLSNRPSSRQSSMARPMSIASSMSMTSEPSDEMLQLVTDLKAERDELKSDVDGWRMRVADYEKQVGVLARRVESERREAWVARERAGLLEVEKGSAEKSLAREKEEKVVVESKYQVACREREQLEAEVAELRGQLQSKKTVEDECARLLAQLAAEKKKTEDLERQLDAAGLFDTPTPQTFEAGVSAASGFGSKAVRSRGLGFQSMDSEATDVDDPFDGGLEQFKLRAVIEEDEEDAEEEEDNELLSYEEEDEGDDSFSSPGPYDSSFEGEEAELIFTPSHAVTAPLVVISAPSRTPSPPAPVSLPAPVPAPAPVDFVPVHNPRNSLSKAWTFPRGPQASAKPRPTVEIDRFFSCLDDLDVSPASDTLARTEEKGKNIFCQMANDSDDEFSMFVLPAHVGVEVIEERQLAAVLEEEEDDDEEDEDDTDTLEDEDFGGEVVDGGIRFTFSPPPSARLEPLVVQVTAPCSPPASSASTTPTSATPTSAIPTTPAVEELAAAFLASDDEDEEDAVFTFPQARPFQLSTPPASKKVSEPPSSVGSVSSISSTPTKATSTPLKRDLPSFIPQPRSFSSSPKPIPPAPAPKQKVSTFIPQPSRKPAAATPPARSQAPFSPPSAPRPPRMSAPTSTPPIMSFAPRPATNTSSRRYDDPRPAVTHSSGRPAVKAAPAPPSPTTSSSALPSPVCSPRSARITLQSFTNFIPGPFSWASRPPKAVPAATEDATFVEARPLVEAQVVRGYVSRDKQLERLRLQLVQGRRSGADAGDQSCGKCKGTAVQL